MMDQATLREIAIVEEQFAYRDGYFIGVANVLCYEGATIWLWGNSAKREMFTCVGRSSAECGWTCWVYVNQADDQHVASMLLMFD